MNDKGIIHVFASDEAGIIISPIQKMTSNQKFSEAREARFYQIMILAVYTCALQRIDRPIFAGLENKDTISTINLDQLNIVV